MLLSPVASVTLSPYDRLKFMFIISISGRRRPRTRRRKTLACHTNSVVVVVVVTEYSLLMQIFISKVYAKFYIATQWLNESFMNLSSSSQPETVIDKCSSCLSATPAALDRKGN